MRLLQSQKDAALASRPGAKLVRVLTEWIVVWHDPGQHRMERWRAQRLSKVLRNQIEGGWTPWWNPEVGASTRRAAIALAIGGDS